MTKTTNYQLNQWDAADPIRREDFNADNAKLDAALAEVKSQTEEVQTNLTRGLAEVSAANCLVKLGGPQVTTTKNETVIFDLTDLDTTLYSSFMILGQGESSYGIVTVSVNSNEVMKLFYNNNTSSAALAWLLPVGNATMGYSVTAEWDGEAGNATTYAGGVQVKWANINKVKFSGTVSAGATYTLYGIKA